QRLTTCNYRMDENPLAFLSQVLECLVLQHVMPEGNKSGRASIHHERAALCQKPFHEQVKFPLVHTSLFQEIQSAHGQSAIFSQSLVHRVCINALYILTF